MKKLLAILLFLSGPAFAQTAISVLPSATTPLAGSEVVPVVQSSQTRKVPAGFLGSAPPSLKAYGAKCDGITDDTTIINTALAAGAFTVQGGTCLSSLNFTSVTGQDQGFGQIIDGSSNKRAQNGRYITGAPSSLGNYNSPLTAFNGDWSHGQGNEIFWSGACTLGCPTTGYMFTPELAYDYTYSYNTSGSNHDTADNGGRTAAVAHFTQVYQHGQGDDMAYQAQCFGDTTNPGATSWLAEPACTLYGGQATAGANGFYLNPVEIQLNDNSFDATGIAYVTNLTRTVNTAALGQVWFGARIQSIGSAEIEAAYSASGKMKTFIDATPETLDATNPAWAVTTCGARWYANAVAGTYAFSSLTGGGSGGMAYVGFDCALQAFNFGVLNNSVFQIGAHQITSTQPAKVAVLAASQGVTSIVPGASGQTGTGATAACAAGHRCDDISGEITLATGTGSLTAGTAITVNFTWTRANAPNCAMNLQGGTVFLAPTHTSSATQLTFGVGVALTPSTTYTADYVCGGI